ncbi:MAG: hypothetical protein HOE90_05805 [Bacteriovoracaceae bacterium]|jgi:hypothetical protein|nr:hypothetical protein [Bacteriovoracaceae bacterium]
MKLADLLSKYPNIELMDNKRGPELATFLSSAKIKVGEMELKYQFDMDPSIFGRAQGVGSIRFIMTNNDRSIQGYAVFTFKTCMIKGALKQAIYISDLRAGRKLSLSARRQWKSSFEDIMKNHREIDELKRAAYIFGAIFDKNRSARNFMEKYKRIQFDPLYQYHAISLIGRNFLKKFPPIKASTFRYQRLTGNGETKLIEFYHLQNSKKYWGEFYNGLGTNDEWERRKKTWPGYQIKDFICIFNSAGKIVGGVLPWSPSSMRKIVIDKVTDKQRLFNFGLKCVGKNSFNEGQEMKILYLTHLEIDRTLSIKEQREVFSLILSKVYRLKIPRLYHIVSFCLSQSDPLLRVLKGDIVEYIPSTIYQLNWKENNYSVLPTMKEMSFEPAIS